MVESGRTMAVTLMPAYSSKIFFSQNALLGIVSTNFTLDILLVVSQSQKIQIKQFNTMIFHFWVKNFNN